ncbi:MAG: glycosyltransferase [Opitutae bacterium]|nr:glycosyltransferase [Opitutae bacterium]
MLPRFSIVVPAYNEARLLPRLIATLQAAAQRYSGGPEQIEIIVADNSSTDETAAVARNMGCQVARVERRAIAAARNGGAQIARGEILGFVDADMQVHPETFDGIDGAIRRHGVIGGATGVRPERWSAGIAATWAMVLPMVWLFGMDTGVVFCRRADFLALGGYREDRLVAEDVDFLVRLKRRGWRQRQRFVRIPRFKAIVSMRKFDKHGDWHQIPSMVRLGWNLLFAKAKFDREIQCYWYEDR